MGTSKITNITKIKCEPTKVFDITVSKNHNFILNNGLVVHNCRPYQYLRSSFYEQRFEMYKSERLFDECIDVERNIETGKVDHSPNGHKDVLDAVCGATYNASKNAEQYAFEYGEDLETTITVSSSSSDVDKKQININFEQELMKTMGSSVEKEIVEGGNTLIDFGMGKATTNYVPNYISNGIVLW